MLESRGERFFFNFLTDATTKILEDFLKLMRTYLKALQWRMSDVADALDLLACRSTSFLFSLFISIPGNFVCLRPGRPRK